MVVALIASSGVRLINIPDPAPREVSVPENKTRRAYEGDRWVSRPIYRTRRFIRQDAHTYIEAEEIGSVR